MTFCGIEQALVHVDVDDLRAVGDLIARHVERGGIIAGLDQFAEFRRAGDIGALADVHEIDVRRQRERLEAREAQQRLDPRHVARLDARDPLGYGGDMRRRRAAAAADDIDETALGEFAEQIAPYLPGFRRKARIHSAGRRWDRRRRMRIGDARKFGDMGAHLARAERAIEADGERLRMAQRMPEGRRRLAGKRAAGKIGDRAGNHHRQRYAGLLEASSMPNRSPPWRSACRRSFRRGGYRRRLRSGLSPPRIGGAQFVESSPRGSRVRYVRRDRGGAVGRAHGAGDEARLAVAPFRFDRRFTGEARALRRSARAPASRP